MSDEQKRSTSQIILEAIQDLHASERIVTRETLADVTQLKLVTIDDRLSRLVDEGLILRVQRGVFVPAPQHKPARIITQTALPGGFISIEIGDDHVLQLTPREYRTLGLMCAGAAHEYARIEAGNDAAMLAAELAVKVRHLERTVRALRANHSDSQQMDLPVSEG